MLKTQRCQFYKKHFPSFDHFLPLHSAAPSKVKPLGQVQLSPSFTMMDGQMQTLLLSCISWFPGHCGARLEFGEVVVVKGAANAKKKRELLKGNAEM